MPHRNEEEVLIGIDVESSGTEILAIALGILVNGTITTRLYKMYSRYTEFSDEVYEFWHSKKNINTLEMLRYDGEQCDKEQIYKEQYRAFYRELARLKKTYLNITIVADNPSLDIGTINSDLQRYVNKRIVPIESINNRWRKVIDPSQLIASHISHVHRSRNEVRNPYLQFAKMYNIDGILELYGASFKKHDPVTDVIRCITFLVIFDNLITNRLTIRKCI